jgi:MFS family permease
MSLGGLVTLISGSMIAPSLSAIGEDLGIGEAETQLTLSIFVLAFAFDPLILAPLTEVFGRRTV